MALGESEVELLATSLQKHAEVISAAATMPAAGGAVQKRDDAVRRILGRSAELMRGASALGMGRNSVALSIVSRAILENLIYLLWIEISDNNAEAFEAASNIEFARVTRLNLASKNLKILDRHTGEDATAEFLKSDRFKNLPRRKSVADCAEESGITGLYNVFYRYMSMETHGHELGGADLDIDADLYMKMQGVGAMGLALGHAGVRWLVHRERTDHETLRVLLGISK